MRPCLPLCALVSAGLPILPLRGDNPTQSLKRQAETFSKLNSQDLERAKFRSVHLTLLQHPRAPLLPRLSHRRWLPLSLGPHSSLLADELCTLGEEVGQGRKKGGKIK